MAKLKYQFTCKNCGSIGHAATKRRVFCKNTRCRQEYHESKSGEGKNKWIKEQNEKAKQKRKSKQNPNRSIQIPTPLLHHAIGEVNLGSETLDQLKNRKAWLIQKFNLIAHKNAGAISFLKVIGALAGAAIGLKIKESMMSMIVGSFIFYFVGTTLGEQLKEEMTAAEYKKLEDLKRDIQKVNERITEEEMKIAGIEAGMKRLPQNEKYTSMTATELAKARFETISVEGKYEQVLGSIERGFKLAMYGAKGSGKSTIAIDLANDLKNYGKVVYISAEEGVRATLAKKIRLLNIDTPYIKFEDERTVRGIESKISKDTSFVFIDSITMVSGLNADTLQELYKRFPHVSFITILKANKSGDYRGSTDLVHDVDIVWEVKDFTIINEKNRYGGTGTLKVEIGKTKKDYTGIIRNIGNIG